MTAHHTSRRAILAGAAAVALPVNVAHGAQALPGELPARPADPIFAAIDAHRSAVADFMAAVKAESRLEEALPRERRKSTITAYERTIVETDDPRWIESEIRIDQTGDAMEDAAIAILDIEPETLQGAAAALRYMVEHIDEHKGEAMGWPQRLLVDGADPDDTTRPQDTRSSEYFLMQNVAASLERISG